MALAGCGSQGAPAPAPRAVAVAPAAPDDGGGHGRGGGGGTDTATASWPAGVPVPAGRMQQSTTGPGLWMTTVLIAAGLDAACRAAAGTYEAAGWTITSAPADGASGPTELRGPGYVATIVCTAADHSPSETLATVHLAVD